MMALTYIQESRMAQKWQVPLGRPTAIPFKRGLFMIGVRALAISGIDGPGQELRPCLVHLAMLPTCRASTLWLGDNFAIQTIKTIAVKPQETDICREYHNSEVEMYAVDFHGAYSTVHMTLFNHRGEPLSSQGHCLLDVCEV